MTDEGGGEIEKSERFERRAYDCAHKRVVKLWGKASQYPCVSCGRPARDWAYDHTDPTSPAGKRRYSSWPEFYMPMCHRCHLRYDRDHDHRFAQIPLAAAGPTCYLPACPKRSYRFGMCRMHYDRCRRYGGPGPVGMIGKRAPLHERFTNRVQVDGPTPTHNPGLGPCSLWTGYIHDSGFGAIRTGHRLIYVHRYAYEQAYGPIPVGRCVQQVCRTKLCVRADHLTLRP